MDGLCKVCGSPTKLINKKKGYRTYCSRICLNQDPEIKLKKSLSTDYSDIKKKREFTLKEKCGCENISQVKGTTEKREKTMLERYGVSSAMALEEFKTKQQKTVQERYNVDNVSKIDSVKNKISKKLTLSDSTVNEKMKGFASLAGEFHGTKAKSLVKCSKCGYEYKTFIRNGSPSMCPQCKQKENKLKSYESLLSRLKKDNFEALFSEDDFITKYNSPILPVKCTSCGTEQSMVISVSNAFVCRVCNPTGTSVFENKILSFIKENYSGPVLSRSKLAIPPWEVDIFLPELKIAIEYNGTYWHSEKQGKGKFYHITKTNLGEASGIRVIHFYEYVTSNKWNIVQAFILHILGKSNRIGARFFSCKKIEDKNLEKSFLEENHIQGYAPSKVAYGLIDKKGELVSLMSFCEPRFSEKYEWELLRFVTKKGVSIIGGASKLMALFIKEVSPNTIITYADRALFTGSVYKSLGFTFSHNSAPSYFYTKDYKKLENRQKFMRKSLNDTSSKTEFEIMESRGYDRLWTCGNSVFTWSGPLKK